MDITPDFSNAVPVVDNAIATVAAPDFSNSEPEQPKTAPRDSVISKVMYHAFNLFPSPIQRMRADMWVADHVDDKSPTETDNAYAQRLHQGYTEYDASVVKDGVEKVLEDPMDAAIAIGAVTHPVNTAAGLAGYTALDHILDLRKRFDDKFPDAVPEVKDLVSLGSMALNVAILGGGVYAANRIKMDKHIEAAGVPKTANMPSDTVVRLQETSNLLPEEKLDMAQTLGVTSDQMDASVAGGLPINVTTESFLNLATKPYWERAKEEILKPPEVTLKEPNTGGGQDIFNASGEQVGKFAHTPEEGVVLNINKESQGQGYGKAAIKTLFDSGIDGVMGDVGKANTNAQGFWKAIGGQLSETDSGNFKLYLKKEDFNKSSKSFKGPDVKDLQGAIAQKNLSVATMTKLKKFMSVQNIKNATPEQVEKLTAMIGDLKEGDKFLSEKQVAALDDILKTPNPEVTPKRIVAEKFGEQDEILDKGILSNVAPELVPSVDIKRGHPLITKIINEARDLFQHAESEVNRRNKEFDKMITAAEKSRFNLLTPQEKLSRSLSPQNKEIFRAMGGFETKLTKEEAGVVAYLRNFFNKAKKDLALEKYRKHYVTHMEKTLTEKILTKGLIPAIKEMLAEQKPNDLPVDIMLELENIIGSEKFFKYALERKGYGDPSTNLRQIINTYSNLYETKMALDKVLPEGQAVVQELLKGKSALWMKKFLQNLKGRGMDNQFRTGPMAWLAKTADAIVDVGYIKMLGLNWKSAIKNVVAGEANAWIYHDFPSYLEGKKRFISNPKRAYDLAKQFGILDGTYADYAQKGIGSLKKLQDASMIGQRLGEVEVRGSIMASMMTEAEWKSGELSKDRINEMKDVVAMTQGVFSKMDSPLLLQTWYGRMFFQMNRWRITNALLMRRIVADAAADVKAGNYKSQNVIRLGKMLTAYGTGMYIANELYKAGYKTAGDVAKNMAQNIDGVLSLFSNGDMVKMFTDNPTLHVLKEIGSTIQDLTVYLHVPGAKKSKEPGIEDTYIAPVETAQDILSVAQ